MSSPLDIKDGMSNVEYQLMRIADSLDFLVKNLNTQKNRVLNEKLHRDDNSG